MKIPAGPNLSGNPVPIRSRVIVVLMSIVFWQGIGLIGFGTIMAYTPVNIFFVWDTGKVMDRLQEVLVEVDRIGTDANVAAVSQDLVMTLIDGDSQHTCLMFKDLRFPGSGLKIPVSRGRGICKRHECIASAAWAASEDLDLGSTVSLLGATYSVVGLAPINATGEDISGSKVVRSVVLSTEEMTGTLAALSSNPTHHLVLFDSLIRVLCISEHSARLVLREIRTERPGRTVESGDWGADLRSGTIGHAYLLTTLILTIGLLVPAFLATNSNMHWFTGAVLGLGFPLELVFRNMFLSDSLLDLLKWTNLDLRAFLLLVPVEAFTLIEMIHWRKGEGRP